MRREVIDAAITHQFKRYLKSKNKEFDKLTEDELKIESVNFLKDKYPGAKKPPHNLIELMASQEVQRSMKSTKLVFPNELKSCKAHAKRRKKRSIGPTCPNGWYKNILGDCLKYVGQFNFLKATEECKKYSNARVVDFIGESAAVMFKDYEENKISGMPLFSAPRNKQFWLQAMWVGDDKNGPNSIGDFKYWNGKILGGDKYMTNPKDLTQAKKHDPSTRKCTVAVPHEDGHFKLRVVGYPCNQKRHTLCRIANTSPPSITIDDVARTISVGESSNTDQDLPEFPCQALSKRKRSTENQNDENNSEDTPKNIQKLNLLLDPEKEEERKAKINKTRMEYKDNFGGMNYTVVYENLLEILWYSQLPCFDVKNITSTAQDELSMIKKCSWKEKEMPCQEIFKTLPTDRGMCCSFNMEKAENIFQKSTYSDLVQDMQEFDQLHRYINFDNL